MYNMSVDFLLSNKIHLSQIPEEVGHLNYAMIYANFLGKPSKKIIIEEEIQSMT